MKYLSLVLIVLLTSPVQASSKKHTDFVSIKSNEANIFLSTNKIARAHGEVDKELYLSFKEEMENTKNIDGDRLILIDSPGGRIDYGDKMIELLEQEKLNGVRIVCYVEKSAHSMAFNLLTHCDVRLMNKLSLALVHKIAFSELEDSERLTAVRLRKLAAYLDKADEKYRTLNSIAMDLTTEEYDYYADRETYWTPESLYKRKYLQGFATLDN